MKTQLLLLGFILSTFFSFAQKNDLIYDVSTKSFINEIKELKKDEKGDIYLKNFNPFLYTISIIDKKHSDTSSKFIPSIINIFGNSFGLAFPTIPKFNKRSLASLSLYGEIVSDETDEIDADLEEFYNLYEEYLNVYISLKKEEFACTNLDTLITKINNRSLVDQYFKVKDRVHDVDSEQIISLEILKNNLENYLKNAKNCILKIGEYTVSGDFTIIDISLIPREEAKSFEFPLNTIKVSTNIKTKNRKKVWFSSGVMLSKNLNSDYFVQSDGVDNYKIMKENRGSGMPGISTLANMEIQNKLSLSVGGGVNIEGTPHLLTGISYPLNTSNLYLNIGYGWAYRNTLSDGLSEKEVYTTAPTIKTKKILNRDFWFGLSYKL